MVCVLALALCYSPAEAFLMDSIINTVNGAIDSVTNTINTVTMVGQFLIDNAISPALTVLQQSTFSVGVSLRHTN